MNFQQIQYAVRLAETLSFVRAADFCNVTQSTLSNGLAQLEAELGEALFTRTTRAVILSRFGEAILPDLRDVLKARAMVFAKAAALLDPLQQVLRIGVSPLIEPALMEMLVALFRQEQPDTEVILREMNLREMVQMVQAGQLDFVFGPFGAAIAAAGLMTMTLYDEPLIYVPCRNVGDMGDTKVALTAIAAERFLMVPDSCGLSTCTENLFATEGERLQVCAGKALSYVILQDWARIGVGAALVPQSKLHAGATRTLVERRDGRVARIGYGVFWQEATMSSVARQFNAHLVARVPQIVAGLASLQ